MSGYLMGVTHLVYHTVVKDSATAIVIEMDINWKFDSKQKETALPKIQLLIRYNDPAKLAVCIVDRCKRRIENVL